MLECIHSLVTVHKYPLISMKRHLMEGQSDKHAQAFTHSLRKREKTSYKFACWTQSITYCMCAFPALCPSFIWLKCVLTKAKLLDRFWKPIRHCSYIYFLVAKSGSLLCRLEAITNFTQSPVECLVKSKEDYLLQNLTRKYHWVCFQSLLPRYYEASLFQWIIVNVEKKSCSPPTTPAVCQLL